MEWKIGEIRQVNGEWYQCVENPSLSCKECSLYIENYNLCKLPIVVQKCTAEKRSDFKDVIFKKLEKVGEPFIGNGGIFQSYKLAMPIYGHIPEQIIGFTTEEVVIKQNKENMKEKKLSMKPFDPQKAKAGKPVCTRDGRKARIICFDIQDKDNPIAAAVYVGECEVIYLYTNKGEFQKGDKNGIDLMMLPEKKEGWVNVYKVGVRLETGGYVHSTKDAAIKCIDSDKKHIATVKIEWEDN